MRDDHESKANQQSGPANAELTRRGWFLILGQAAASAGFSGAIQAQERNGFSLPLGLYEPSNEHLAHALASADRFHPVPPGSRTDYVSPGNGPYRPQFFSVPEFRIIRRIVELMLGEKAAQSNGASQAADDQRSVVEEVAEWIDLSIFSSAEVREATLRLAPAHRAVAAAFGRGSRIRQVEPPYAQQTTRQGLRWLAEEVSTRYHADFLDLNEKHKIEILSLISDEGVPRDPENAGTRFFALVKAELIRGFYTSKAGLKELDNKGNGFYTESPGCKTR